MGVALSLLANPIVRKLLLGALVLFAISAAAFAAIKHYEAKGAEQQRAAQEKADAAWMKGAVENMDKVQRDIAPVVAALAEARKKNADLEAESARLSVPNNDRPAFDAGAVGRLQRAGAKP